MRHSWSISDSPDLPIQAFRKALGKNRPETLEGKGGGPSAPDPYTVANAQTGLFQQNAAFNKALNLGNYSNPFGSQSSGIAGYDPATGAPIYQTNVSANPQLQGLLNQQMNGVGQAQTAYQNAMGGLQGLAGGFRGIGGALSGISSGYGNLIGQSAGLNADQAMKQGQDAYYKSATGYLDPQYAQQQESLDAKLAAQGLAPGSQAYSNAYGNFQRDKDFAYNQAANSAITQGQQLGLNKLQASQNLINQQAGLLGSQAGIEGQQAQNLGAIGGLYGQQLNGSQLGYQNLGQIASLIPGYTGVGQSGANPADIAGAFNNQYLGQLGQYNARQQGQNATASNLAGLFGNLSRANSAYNWLGGNGLSSYGNMLSSISPGAAGSLGDALGMSLGGTYGPSTQAGLDALIGSFNGGTSAAAAGGAAEAGAAGAAGAGAEAGAAGAAGSGAGAGAGAGAAAVPAALPAATALPFLIAAYGMFNGLTGRSDDGTPLTNMQDLYSTALATNPGILNQYPTFNSFLQTNFGGNPNDPNQQYSWDNYDYARRLLNTSASPGNLLAGVFGGNDA